MSLWEANLEVLRRRAPEAARRVEQVRPASDIAVWSVSESARLTRRWISGLNLRPGALIALAGFGDGCHVRALLGELSTYSAVFVAEADAGEFRGVLERTDIRDILQDARLLLGVGEPDEAMLQILRGEHAVAMTDIVPLIFAPSFNRAPEAYSRFFTEFARFVDFRRRLEGTRLADAPMWQASTIRNLPLLADAPDLIALREVFRGRSAVLVSAGPSLDESLEFLREASRSAVIIAVNSSYRAVRHAGIVPHFVLAADPREFTARGFRGVPVDGTWLVTTPIVNHEVVERFDRHAFIWSGGNELFTEVRRRCGLEPGSQIVEQGTVSACGVDLAIVLGCEKLCLVGQDLAVRGDGRSHAEDSFYTDDRTNRSDVEACRRLPGNTLPEVLVEDKLYVYLKTFEQLVTQRPQLRMRNVSRLGARIAGVPYLDFVQALAWLGRKPLGDADAAIARRCIREKPFAMAPAAALAALAPTRVFAREALALALKCAARCEAVPEMYSADKYRDDPLVRAAFEAVQALEERLAAEPDEYRVLESGRTRLELFRVRELGKRLANSGAAEHWTRLMLAQEFAWAIAEGAWFLLNQLQSALPVGATAGGESVAKIA